ncbi:putative uncharacterized protein [Parachlamydia acanthamoebae UV-7]|uniref:Uncharacterized protein n=1 Tax=Parachlamydia acanthamoebae (strain UV7) TaxID=765952 RepID=F8KWH2_PARAV|nr:hypothetical protein pah_c009o039 [Parachlamydia acanthamoebae str. Hall's coccus]CCB85370.1 putative uncharacterized protein [Parachlamydia acanthamoebae UV-7]
MVEICKIFFLTVTHFGCIETLLQHRMINNKFKEEYEL